MNPTALAHLRLINQHITSKKIKKPEEMVAQFAAMQAQEYAQSKWALGLRMPQLADTDIEAAFTAGKILRTHLLRPTWHFVTPADIRWMLALTAPRVHAVNAFMYRKTELDEKLFRRANAALVKALQGHQQLTRTELNTALQKASIKADGMRLSYIMMYAELEGIVCSGARRGNQFTYALLEERVAPSKPLTKEQALAELTRRYFTSRGPATAKDFATWSGLSMADVKKGLVMVSAELVHEKIGEEEYHFPPFVSPAKDPVEKAFLLPIYDEYIMGYRNRDAILQLRNSIQPPPSFVFDSTIIIDGQVVGTWKRALQKKEIVLEYSLFKPLGHAREKLLADAVRRFEKFNGLPASLLRK